MNYDLKLVAEGSYEETRIYENCYLLCSQRSERSDILSKVQQLGGCVNFPIITLPTNEKLHELALYIEELIANDTGRSHFSITVDEGKRLIATFEKSNTIEKHWKTIREYAILCNGKKIGTGFDFPSMDKAVLFLEHFCKDFLV